MKVQILKLPSQGKKSMTKSLLVVEDEVLVARDIKSRLTRMGYEVLGTASKGAEAIEKALSLRPDLILMDIHLQDEIDGVDAAIKIRETYDVPVIFCTAYSNEETLERAKVSTPYGYVLKPFDNRELEINIEIALYKHQMEKDLANTRQRLDATLTSISDGVIVTDLQGKVCLFNHMAERITGWHKQNAEAAGLSRVMLLRPFDEAGEEFDTAALSAGNSVVNLRQRLVRANQAQLPIEISTNVIQSGSDELVVITFRDITRQISFEEKIRKSAFFDDLTGLANRSLFIDRLERAITRRERGAKDDFAVVFIDLDGFSTINEGLGHQHGDQLLKVVGTRIEQTVRPDDTVSRFGSDIYAILLDPVDSAAGAIEACQRIQKVIGTPIDLGDEMVDFSASCGIVLNRPGATAQEIMRDADTALHRAKADAKGAHIIFDDLMYQNALGFIKRKSSMQQALNDGVFEVYYQPIVDVQTERLVSMEALVRWPHPTEGFVSPAEFIPIAERTGLILPLGEYVLRAVCQQISCWNHRGIGGFRVAVNLSARQFENNVPDMVGGIIRETGISPLSLALEITEGIAMKNVDQNIRMLKELRALGLSISIDDFGTGYSSLAYLKRFPLNTLKIDRSFIQDITQNTDDQEITRAIIAMGQNLGLKVLAEGVETERQVTILRDSGCDYIQGYYYSRPLPASQLANYLKQENILRRGNCSAEKQLRHFGV
ncbi:MAG: diguanylate cyclase (GGDEF)-like protein/PAS domain S-box-containing protein [Candidatus Azotimanducaceae bacterium]|jgi:diguanylate cyclase (GGDEF)-like protein/PAS domain S-box-containing protein